MPPRDSVGGSDDSKDVELDWDWIGQLDPENFSDEDKVSLLRTFRDVHLINSNFTVTICKHYFLMETSEHS